MPKQIIFVRHGETDHNKSRRLMNWTHDVGSLTDVGKQEAAIVGKRLKKYPIGAMYVSDLQRTRETGEIISQHINLAPKLVPALRERNLGIFGDLTFDEIKEKWPEKLAKFMDHADKEWHDFEGESLREVRERFTSFLEQMEKEHADENVLFVTHSGILYTVLRDVYNFFPQDTWMDVAHTSITILEKSQAGYQLKVFNDTITVFR